MKNNDEYGKLKKCISKCLPPKVSELNLPSTSSSSDYNKPPIMEGGGNVIGCEKPDLKM
jgi:hypothetical protein